MVGECFAPLWSLDVSQSGARRSKNVGTSNHNQGEIPWHRKTKVSLAMVIIQGLVGPKAMAKAAADGHTVNIPWLSFKSKEGRSLVCKAHYWICVRRVRMVLRQIREPVHDLHKSKPSENPAGNQWRFYKAGFQEKLLRLFEGNPYHKPTQVVSSRRVRWTSERSSRNSAKNRP